MVWFVNLGREPDRELSPIILETMHTLHRDVVADSGTGPSYHVVNSSTCFPDQAMGAQQVKQLVQGHHVVGL